MGFLILFLSISLMVCVWLPLHLATMTMGRATFHPTYTLKSLHNKHILNLRMFTSITPCFHVDMDQLPIILNLYIFCTHNPNNTNFVALEFLVNCNENQEKTTNLSTFPTLDIHKFGTTLISV